MLGQCLLAQSKLLEVVETYRPAVNSLNDEELIEGGHEGTIAVYAMTLCALRRIDEAKELAKKALKLIMRTPASMMMGAPTVFEMYALLYETAFCKRGYHEAAGYALEAGT